MRDYTEYYTVVYRNDQRMIILDDNAKPTKKTRLKLAKDNYYAEKKNVSSNDILPNRYFNPSLRRTPFKLLSG